MVTLTCGRSDALYEDAVLIPEAVPTEVELGPFEFVEMTYESLRVGPHGDDIGRYRDGYWWIDGDPYPFSDLDITAAKQ